MNVIFGWIAPPQAPFPSVPTHQDAIGRTGHSLSPSALQLVDPSGSGGDLSEHARAAAAVAGTPLWKDAALHQLSAGSGHAAALLRAVETHGLQVERYASGHFALAVLDKAERSVLLAVDRFATRSLYYHVPRGGGLVFAGTLECLCRHPAVAAELDPQALYDYVYFHMIPSPGTVYRDIRKLEPGQCLVYKDGRLELRHYWQPEFTETSAPFASLKEELHHLLAEAVRRCRPDDRTGAFLSGGLDSSTVAGVLARQSRGPVDTYSIGFDADGYDEMEYARAAGTHFGLRMHEYYVTPADVVEALPQIAGAYDEPFGNSSAVPALFCARLAKRDGIEVLLAGDGGDELFAGNVRYVKQKIFDAYRRVPGLLRAGLLEPLLLGSPAGRIAPLRKARSYIEQARVPMPDRMETYNFLHRTPAEQVFTADFLARVDTGHPLAHLRGVYGQCRAPDLVDRMLQLDWKITLADNDLRKVGRMCELAGVDVRYPMLDDALVDFSLRVPAALKLRRLDLRHFYKQAMQDFLPAKIIRKSKHGFGLPFGEWLRDSSGLRDLAGDALRSLQGRGIVQSGFIDRMTAAHREDHAAYYGSMIWVLVMLELWLDRRPARSAAA